MMAVTAAVDGTECRPLRHHRRHRTTLLLVRGRQANNVAERLVQIRVEEEELHEEQSGDGGLRKRFWDGSGEGGHRVCGGGVLDVVVVYVVVKYRYRAPLKLPLWVGLQLGPGLGGKEVALAGGCGGLVQQTHVHEAADVQLHARCTALRSVQHNVCVCDGDETEVRFAAHLVRHQNQGMDQGSATPQTASFCVGPRTKSLPTV
jgi:hypothetical protein